MRLYLHPSLPLDQPPNSSNKSSCENYANTSSVPYLTRFFQLVGRLLGCLVGRLVAWPAYSFRRFWLVRWYIFLFILTPSAILFCAGWGWTWEWKWEIGCFYVVFK